MTVPKNELDVKIQPDGSITFDKDKLMSMSTAELEKCGLSQSKPIEIKIKKLRAGAPDFPKYATPGAAGMDLRADLSGMDEYIQKNGILFPPKVNYTYLVPTGFSMVLPPGYEAQVRSRSGLALKNQVVVLNAPGTVDSDYRGEVGVILTNFGHENFVVKHGDRIAQMVIAKVEQLPLVEVQELDATERGAGGFGHTGNK